jgi:hypothetical protein
MILTGRFGQFCACALQQAKHAKAATVKIVRRIDMSARQAAYAPGLIVAFNLPLVLPNLQASRATAMPSRKTPKSTRPWCREARARKRVARNHEELRSNR